MMDELHQQLDSINDRLESFLRQASSVTGSMLPGISPEQVTDLLSGVLQAGAEIAAHANTAGDPEVGRYRRNLERLRGVLPQIEIQLRLERARLESEREHLQAASDWAAASKHVI